MGVRPDWKILLVLLVWISAAPAPGRAADPDSISAAEPVAEAHEDSTAVVVLQRRELFEVRSLGLINAQERAAQVSAEILALAESHDSMPEDLRLVRDDRIKATGIVSGRKYVTAVFDHEAEVLDTTTAALAAERLEIIRQAVIEYRSDYSATTLVKSGIIAVLAVILYVAILRGIIVFRRRFEGSLQRRLENRTLFKVLKGEVLVRFVLAIDKLIHFVLVLWLTLAALNYLLSLFPWTYGIASRIFELAAGPMKAFGKALVALIPSLFFLAFIIVMTMFTLRGIRFFFDEIGKGRISIGGFYPAWARPTFNIIRVVVLAFAFIVAFPYIPGSGSAAFKGVSIFMGLLVSLGSGSAVANAVSGIILIYMRPFSLGDRVRIGEAIGDVIELNLLTTRIRTTKNVTVTVPNNNILSGQIANFTTQARTRQLILHTSITIGYDVPWQRVHELLISAARATDNVLADPEPFVLQKALQDFYVEYEINVYTDKPRSTSRIYSDLHRNIQIAFDAAEVEIMSPHGRMVSESRPKFPPRTEPTEDTDVAGEA